MTLRTPRRRISPRTKRRYRAIKDFLRRIAGNSSQTDIKINSSIAVNVTNLKNQILGLDQQLDDGSKHVICAECTSTSDTQSCFSRTDSKSVATAKASRVSAAKENCIPVASVKSVTSAERNPRETKTELLYKTINDRKSDDSGLLERREIDHNEIKYVASKRSARDSPKTRRRRKSKRRHHAEMMMEDYIPYYEKHKTKSAYEQFSSALSAHSYHSLIETRWKASRGDFNSHHRHHTSRQERRRAYDRDERYIKRDIPEIETREVLPRRMARKTSRDISDIGTREVSPRRMARNISRDIPDIGTREVSPRRIARNEDEKKYLRRRKEKPARQIDHDYINNIIKRQYRPIKLFGKRESNLSQFSAPVCRDQEFSIPENIIEGAELCSCCHADRNHRYNPYNELSDMRSICDTRLYSSNRNTRPKTYWKPNNHYNYNDSSMYDVVPVKEKSSPKSRRKFIEDMMCYSHYREVPPSPRTQRPRLNLKAQHYYNEMELKEDPRYRSRKCSPNRHNRHQDYIDSYTNESSTALEHRIPYNIKNKQVNVQQTIGTSSTLPPPLFMNVATNNQAETTNTTSLINKSQDIDSSTDKTDKALCEIKDILQNFLQEIKKESIQIEKETSCKSEGVNSSTIKQNNGKINSSFENPSCHSDINNVSMAPFPIPSIPPYIPPPYLNPCCYPVMPSYPINCMQNGFAVPPSPSFTCANCTNKMEQPQSPRKEDEISKKNTKRNTETDKLIKEIYNLVTQSPTSARNDERSVKSHKTTAGKRKPLVTRSVGDSVRITRHDAKVGTPKLKYYSKSCEAIGSQQDDDRSANISFSDTVLEKMSMDATAAETTTETENTDDTVTQKKSSKLTNVLRTFGLMKKKKYVIEEEEDEDEEESSESESSTEVEVSKKKRKKPEFPQEFANYMMYGQEHFHPPPHLPPHLQHEYLAQQQGYHNLHNPYGPYPGYPFPSYHPSAPPCPCALEGAQSSNQKHPGPPDPGPPHPGLPHPGAPHAGAPHEGAQHPTAPHPGAPHPGASYPGAPFSLKEIEVKSTATQSERKFPLFGKFGKKATKPEVKKPSHPRNFSTQTPAPPAPPKPGFWERLQVPKPANESDPRVFSFKKQKELAAGDANLKKAMLKKLFHKRNPFSPGNLIVRTLLGKDPSSFGEPPQMYRPRMFL